MFHLSQEVRNMPVVSDVNDDDLLEIVEQFEKGENVIYPTPNPIRCMPFDVFKTNRGNVLS